MMLRLFLDNDICSNLTFFTPELGDNYLDEFDYKNKTSPSLRGLKGGSKALKHLFWLEHNSGLIIFKLIRF